jgi:hypothetical protein
MKTMQTQNQTENKADYAKYETLGDPAFLRIGRTGFVEVAHKRATLQDGATRDFVLIARGYITRDGRKRTQRLVTIPAELAHEVAAVLGVGGAELRTPQQRLAEAGA